VHRSGICSFCNQQHNFEELSKDNAEASKQIAFEWLENFEKETAYLQGKPFSFKLSIRIRNPIFASEECVENVSESIDKYFEFLNEDLVIRFDSIQTKLDQLNTYFQTKLKELKRKCQDSYAAVTDKANESLTKYRLFIDKFRSQSDEANAHAIELIKHSSEIKVLMEKLRDFPNSVSFEASSWEPDQECIGHLSGDLMLGHTFQRRTPLLYNLKKKMRMPSGMCTLSDNRLLICDTKSAELVQMDTNFDIVSRIKTIGSKVLLQPTSVCTDEVDNVYITDSTNSLIINCDVNFKMIKHVVGTPGRGKLQFDCPKDICFFNDWVFVLETGNKRVQVLTPDCQFEKFIYLYTKPYSEDAADLMASPCKIAVSANTVAVIDEWRYIRLYTFEGSLKQVIDISNAGYVQSLCFVNFYLFAHSSNGRLFCFTNIDSSDWQELFDRSINDCREYSDRIAYFNKKLVISFGYDRSLVTF
jgi:hypothetical protein